MQQLQLWQVWAAGQIDDATAQAAAEAVHARNGAGMGKAGGWSQGPTLISFCGRPFRE
jgi:hypothetical protein